MGSGHFRDDIVGRYEDVRLWVHTNGLVEVVRKNLFYG